MDPKQKMHSNTLMRILVTLLIGLLWPLTASAEENLRVAVISDINGRYGSTAYAPRVASAIEHIVAMAPDVVISTGDMVAGQQTSPHLSRTELETMWRNFHHTVQQPLQNANIPLVMTPGNHDASAYPGFEDERAMYADYHRTNPPLLPIEDGGNFPFYFSTTVGALTLISVDATRRGPLDPGQRQWLAAELDKETTTHTLVFGHLPLQPVGSGRERDVITDPALEQLLREGSVSAYLSGHHHVYYPGRRQGIDMLSIGNLGGNQRTLTGTAQRTGFSFAIIELSSNGELSVASYLAPDYQKTLDATSLPTAIGQGESRLQRRDLPAVQTATGSQPEAIP